MIPLYMTTTTLSKRLHTNILELIFTTSSIGIIELRKGLLVDGKVIMGLKTIVNKLIFGVGIRISSSLRLLLHMLLFMNVKNGAVVSLVNPGES
jgi:hypothetical protein